LEQTWLFPNFLKGLKLSWRLQRHDLRRAAPSIRIWNNGPLLETEAAGQQIISNQHCLLLYLVTGHLKYIVRSTAILRYCETVHVSVQFSISYIVLFYMNFAHYRFINTESRSG
jgi:hypothetical protein